jgi:periplasmic divalent cation tolerance protein
VQNEQEFRILAKTTAERYADVEAAIRELHSYELPAIYAFEACRVFEPYARWVAENSAGPGR